MNLSVLQNEVMNASDNILIREKLIDFEGQIKKQEGAFVGDNEYCPLKHSFSDGIYVREISIPANTYIVGKIHLHDHPNFLMSGKVDVVTENGIETLEGPLSMISPKGTKRALRTITSCVWITVHKNPTNTQDLSELEKIVIADSYEEYDKFIASQKRLSFVNKILNKFKIRRLQLLG